MAEKYNSFNVGAEGATIDLGTTNGSAITQIAQAGAGAGVHAAAAAARGARGAKYTSTAATDQISHRFTDTAANQLAYGIFIVVTNELPAGAAATFMRSRSGTGNTSKWVMNTTGALQLQNAGGTSVKNFNGNAKLANGIYFLSTRVTTGTTTSNGVLEAVIYDASGTVVDSFSSSAANTGTATQTIAEWGKPETSGGYMVNGILLDEPRMVTGASVPMYTFPAATPTNALPTASAGADLAVESGADYQLLGSDSDSDGTVVSRSWKLGGTEVGTSALLVRRAPVLAAEATQTYTYTVTDNSGGVTSDDVVVTTRKALVRGSLPDGTVVPYVIRAL